MRARRLCQAANLSLLVLLFSAALLSLFPSCFFVSFGFEPVPCQTERPDRNQHKTIGLGQANMLAN